MKKRCQFHFKLILAFLLVCLGNISNAQNNIISKLLNYKKLVEKNQIEKIHIHTNQPTYMMYDTIWFKAYIINANLNRPSDISKSLTVDLIDPEGNIIRQAKTRINVGLADGYLYLSDSLKNGNYTLRAYTNQMKLFGKDFYYHKNLVIKNKPNISPKASGENLSVSFFPEGGDLVKGLKSVVAFKAIGVNGLGQQVTGKITDDKGKLLSSIITDHLGMGRFALTPEIDKKYFAEIISPGEGSHKYQLPVAKTSGYIINVSSVNDSMVVQITGTTELLNKGLLTLIAAQDGITRYVAKPSLKSLNYSISIPKSTFYTGAVQFTLFDTESLPVAERLSFCNHHDLLSIETLIKPIYTKKESVKLFIDLKNMEGKPDIGSLSVSVYNESLYPFDDDDENSIYSDLLLTSDLKGYIEKPNSYFKNTNNQIQERNLDNLMLTQGWRKFSWKEKLSRSLPEVLADKFIDDEISGKVMLAPGKPFANGDVTLFQSGLTRNILQTKTDITGNFIFKDLIITDTAYFVLSTNTLKEKKNLKIQVNGLESDLKLTTKPDQAKQFTLLSDSLSAENKKLDDLYFKSRGINLHQVNITAKKPGPIKESFNLNGPGKADALILAKDLETTHDLSTYLLNNVTGLKTFEGRIYSRDLPEPDRKFPPAPAPMLVIYDGIQIDQFNFNISDVNPDDVESIEVLKGATSAMYGINGSGGVLIISSKKGRDHSNDALSKVAKGILPLTIVGYQMQKEFYTPFYNANPTNIKDLRKAVYWNPNVITSADKKTELNFYNSDYAGKYKMVIEGINADGQIGRAVYNYEVK